MDSTVFFSLAGLAASIALELILYISKSSFLFTLKFLIYHLAIPFNAALFRIFKFNGFCIKTIRWSIFLEKRINSSPHFG